MTTTEETSDYWVYNNEILVFKPEFDKPLENYINIISQVYLNVRIFKDIAYYLY